mgnify:CR=1 FL=1
MHSAVQRSALPPLHQLRPHLHHLPRLPLTARIPLAVSLLFLAISAALISLALHGVSIDPVARTAEVDGRRLDLTPREFDLLHFFARHPDKVFSRMDLLNQVWGYQHEGYEHTVNTHINRLRTKIEADPSDPRRILTVWGKGYKFAAAPAAPGGAS